MTFTPAGGALRTLLAARGEQLSEVTITVPVAARQAATGGELGNQIGIMPVTVPAAALRQELTTPAHPRPQPRMSAPAGNPEISVPRR